MRWRTPFLLFLPLIVAALIAPNGASAAVVLQAVGGTQGNIPGGYIDPGNPGHDGWIEISSFQHGIAVPIGPTGLPTGTTIVSEVTLSKPFDQASIKFLGATKNHEVFPTFTMDFLDQGGALYYQVALANAYISSYSHSSGGDRPSESMSLSFSTITFTDVTQGISHTYSWDPSGTVAAIGSGQFVKGILLPAAPNPTTGETQFRFSLPAASNAELILFDAQGREVRELYKGWTSAQSMVAEWDGTDARGSKVKPGVYMARLSTRGSVVTQRIAVVR